MSELSHKRKILVPVVGYSIIGMSWVAVSVFGSLVLLLVVNWILFAFFDHS